MATQFSVAFHTLGCKLNFSESSSIKSRFEEAGYLIQSDRKHADIYILNTCSVTDFADRKCRKEIRRFKRQNPQSKVVVIGCYAQLKPKEISEIEGVNLVLGAAEKFRILEFMPDLFEEDIANTYFAQEIVETKDFHHAHSETERTRAFLKVQDGCDYKCTFCTIPLARGKSRSDKIDNILIEANKLARRGIKEIVLTGVNIGDFGHGPDLDHKDLRNKEETFFDLIQVLDRDCPVDRIRISSIEPNLLTDKIIEFVSTSKRFMPHFHIPLQSGSDSVLKDMRRRYNTQLYRSRIEKIKACLPHACIGVDVIVGFPSETEEHFEQSYHFIKELDVSYLHVFTYSERDHTPAGSLPNQVPMEERRRRNARMQELSKIKRKKFYSDHIGQEREVLFEKSKKEDMLTGFSDNYIKIEAPQQIAEVNQIKRTKLSQLREEIVWVE